MVTQCWMSALVQPSGASSFRDGCGGCRTSAKTGGLCAGGVGGWDGSPEPVVWLVPFKNRKNSQHKSPSVFSLCVVKLVEASMWTAAVRRLVSWSR